MESDEFSDLYRIVPFSLLDGINDCGLVVSMNVVPTDYGINVSIPIKEPTFSLCGMMVPRFLLDRFSNAIDAVSCLQDFCSIYPPKKLTDIGYELHFIVSDALGNTFVVELIDNRLKILRRRIMTNFHLSYVKLNCDGKVLTPATQTENANAMTVNNVTPNGCGLERYNLVRDLKCPTKNNVRRLLKDLHYSNAYRNLNWFTEFVGRGLTVASSVKEYVRALAPILDELEYKDRETSVLWQTVHTSLYDFSGTLEMYVQENPGKVFKFTV